MEVILEVGELLTEGDGSWDAVDGELDGGGAGIDCSEEVQSSCWYWCFS
jgi:hypothetical protein